MLSDVQMDILQESFMVLNHILPIIQSRDSPHVLFKVGVGGIENDSSAIQICAHD